MLFLWTRSWPNCGRCYFLSLRTEKCTVCMLFSVLLGGAWCCLVLWKMRKLTLTRTPDPIRPTSLVLTLTRTPDPIQLTSLVLTLTDPFTSVLCTLPHNIWRPMLQRRASSSTVRSQVRLGRPVRRRHSNGVRWICIMHRREHASDALPLHVSRR